MKYNKFRQIVLNRLEEQIENPNPGSWRGKGTYKHIIGNPKSNSQEQIDIINKHILLPNVPKIEHDIHLHTNAHHLNSSQIMCYNFFRPMMNDFDNRKKMYKPTDKLVDLISSLIDTPIEKTGALCAFEYIQKGKESTNFDFYFGNDNIEVFFEIKYTERYFTKSSSSKKPDVQYEKVYKDMIKNAEDIFVDGTICENDFNTKYYQLARNAIRATSSNKYVLFIYPEANENLHNQFKDFSGNCLTKEGKKRIRLLTWESLVLHADELCIDVRDFKNRYLSFLNDKR